VTWLLVALGAAVGAPLRYLVDRAVQARTDSDVPWGTFCVNVSGTFVLGLLLGLPDLSAAAVAAIGTGFCGALTTYSALSWEVMALGERGERRWAIGYLVLTVGCGLAAASLGWWLADILAAR